MNITSHVIIGMLPDPLTIPLDHSMPTLALPHPYAIRTPFHLHPAVGHAKKTPPKLKFGHCLKMSYDKAVTKRTLVRTETPADNDGGLDCALCECPICYVATPFIHDYCDGRVWVAWWGQATGTHCHSFLCWPVSEHARSSSQWSSSWR